jgi:hypothetical protein
MRAKAKPHVLVEARLVGVLKASCPAPSLTHRTVGRIDALIASLSLNHRTKKTIPTAAAMRKADIIIAHHIARVRSSSESSRSIVSLHHLCQALIWDAIAPDTTAPQGKVVARNSSKVELGAQQTISLQGVEEKAANGFSGSRSR